jgi:homocysteine S-methyltransferase
LHNEVPGIDIPSRVRDQMAAAGDDAEAGWKTGLALTVDLLGDLRAAGAAGIYVMPQFGRYDRAAEVIDAVRDASQVPPVDLSGYDG